MDKNRRFGLFVVISSWLGMFCLFGYRATFAVLKIPMSIEMGWSQAQVTLGYSIMMLFYAVSALFCGMALDRFGAKIIYLVGAGFGAAGFLVTSYVDTLYGYYAAYGIFSGIATGMLWVTATVSIRKWYAGNNYARMFGWAYMGQPMAQIIMCLFVKKALESAQAGAWRGAMQMLGVLVFFALLLATVLAKKSPEAYGMKPQGLARPDAASAQLRREYIWSLREAFSTYPIWGVILTFLFSMLAEFLIWAQIVSYWNTDLGLSVNAATNLYVSIGVFGLFAMPLMGIVADKIAEKSCCEAQGRKLILIFGPLIGALACALLLGMRPNSFILGPVVCALFAIYWAVVPGGVVGYTGAIYGRVTLGKIWGLATMVVMGIGPFIGPLAGGYAKDVTGSYRYSIILALASFLASALVSLSLPKSMKTRTKDHE